MSERAARGLLLAGAVAVAALAFAPAASGRSARVWLVAAALVAGAVVAVVPRRVVGPAAIIFGTGVVLTACGPSAVAGLPGGVRSLLSTSLPLEVRSREFAVVIVVTYVLALLAAGLARVGAAAIGAAVPVLALAGALAASATVGAPEAWVPAAVVLCAGCARRSFLAGRGPGRPRPRRYRGRPTPAGAR